MESSIDKGGVGTILRMNAWLKQMFGVLLGWGWASPEMGEDLLRSQENMYNMCAPVWLEAKRRYDAINLYENLYSMDRTSRRAWLKDHKVKIESIINQLPKGYIGIKS